MSSTLAPASALATARGVYTICPTPFHADGALDLGSIATLVEFQIEAGVSGFWRKYVGLEGGVIGIDRFGESAPAGELFREFGFTTENIINTVKTVLNNK